MNSSIEKINEENRLNEVLNEIRLNIDHYKNSKIVFKNKLKTVSNSNEVNVISNYLDLIEKNIRKNNISLLNPYFARIDYFDNSEKKDYRLYIGKHGLQNADSQTLTVDWRAPISSVYYDCQLGNNTIEIYEGEELDLELNLKRTIEIEDSKLIDFYDVDTIANDELLTKYLAKNKEAVLSEIVATIQKDQNKIIRDSYSHNIVVQGGAGSGKTTVAMHRVSYLLYNYKKIFSSDNFYILGSNKMFLDYITSILPSLDAGDIKHMVLSKFFHNFVKEYLPKTKGKEKTMATNVVNMAFKGKIGYVKTLDSYLKKYILSNIPTNSILINDNNIMSRANILNLLDTFKEKSMLEKIDILNDQLKNKIIAFKENNPRLVFNEKENGLADYFGDKKQKVNLIAIYIDFLIVLREKFENSEALKKHVETIDSIVINVNKGKLDIFDLSMLALIKKRICTNKGFEDVKYVVVDEAQDFGVSIFYVLKNVFTKSYFAIMGDVTQNINYDIGMNDWESLKKEVFSENEDKFYTLSKSYRNTIEISNFAGKIFKKATFKTYAVEPFVRHGKSVEVIGVNSCDAMVNKALEIIDSIFKAGYKTIGIICKNVDGAANVSNLLSEHMNILCIDENDIGFSNGVMVMPIQLSKGLEFDTVILWDVNSENYAVCDSDIKLLYVAITRALHELYVLHKGDLTELLV